MRTENSTSTATVLARGRALIHRARRTIASQGTIVRWSLPLGAVAVLVTLAYLASPLPTGTEYLRAGQRFSSDEILQITRALDAKHLSYRVDERRRIEVTADHLDEARDVLAKLDVGPQPLDELQKKAAEPNLFEGLGASEERHERGREAILATFIRKLDGIVSAYVSINRMKTHRGFQPASNATAFVWLETEENREIPPKTVQSIKNIILGNEPDLKPDAVTVCDQKGRYYLKAGDATLGKMTTDRALEARYTEKLLEKLDWVRGVRITVQMVPSPTPAAPLPIPSVPEPTGSPESKVGVNTPLELDPPPNAGPTQAVASSQAPTVKPSEEPRLARFLVYVPRSFYLKATTDRNPSQEELQAIASQTEERIKTAVDFVVDPGEPHQVSVVSIPYDEPASPPRMSQTATDARRSIPWWVPAAAAGAGMAILLFVAFRMLAARRPEPLPSASAHRGRYTVDTPSEPGPGPSERVRELIRLNPESAASVLHRWIGQGGDSA